MENQILNTYFWILTTMKLFQNMIRRLIIVFTVMCMCQTSWAQGDHITLGIGPSMIYGDNSGHYKRFFFKIQPAVTLAFNKQMSEHVGVRGTLGLQKFDSGDYEQYPHPERLAKWGNLGKPFAFKGVGYFADAMPIFTTNPNEMGMLMSSLQFYAGLGFGVMYVQRDQKTLISLFDEEGLPVADDIVTTKESNVIPYIPTRIGFSTNSSKDWDFGLEFVLILTTNSNLDGNDINYNSIGPDMAAQILFTVKRYIGKRW
jgi:hypothetical protein